MVNRIRELAARYETSSFCTGDPSCFMHGYSDARDVEVVGLVAASLAFGRRSEILKHIQVVLDCMCGESPAEWLLSGGYERVFPDDTRAFYRIFSFSNMRALCEGMASILREHGSLGRCFEKDYQSGVCSRHRGRLAAVIASHFDARCTPLIAHGETSACKRLNLYLRWMVRGDSPVDMGLWTWYPRTELLMPLDTHVVTVAKSFGLLPSCATATLSHAVSLTDAMKKIFPADPLKGDFALFGYGVDQGCGE